MSLAARIRREWRFIRPLFRTLSRVRPVAGDSPHLGCDDLEDAVDRWRERTALQFEGRSFTYGEFDSLANRYAHWARARGLRRGGAVAILIVFAILLTRGSESPRESVFSSGWVAGAGVAVAVFAVLAGVILSSHAVSHQAPPTPPATVGQLGEQLMTKYILPLEVLGLLLTAALIGAVIIAMREKENDGPASS